MVLVLWEPSNANTGAKNSRQLRNGYFELKSFTPVKNASEETIWKIDGSRFRYTSSDDRYENGLEDVHAASIYLCPLYDRLARNL